MADNLIERTELDRFLGDLRKLRAQAGSPSLRAMARTAHYSHTALSGVLAGERLPSLDLVLAFVRACHGDENEWRARWHQVRDRPASANRGYETAPAARGRRRLLKILLLAGGPALAAMVAGTIWAMDSGGPADSRHGSGSAKHAPAPCPRRLDPGDHPMIACDDSRFVADVTIPDGTTVRASQAFVKTWQIQNTGLVPWRGRYLQRQGIWQAPGVCSSPPRVPVPTTLPGQVVQISVDFTAPAIPGSCRVDWKMADGQGRLYFPDRMGVYMIVNVSG